MATKGSPAAAGKKKAIFIAEKPDQMRTIEKVYRDHRSEIPYTIDFFAQRGHLLRVPYPEEFDEGLKKWTWDTLPFHPDEHGGWKYTLPDEKKTGKFKTPKERYAEIKKAVVSGGYDFIIHGGDPDQEGELLVWETIEQMRTKLPVKRFWLNDLNEEDVLEALTNLRDEATDSFLQNLHKAATARQRADYRFGMNGTRAVTLKTGATMPIGRVKTPILNIIVKREEAIRNFVPSSVYGVQLDYEEGTSGVLYEPPKGKAGKDEDTGIVWFDTKEEAEEKSRSIKGDAVVKSCTRTKTETPPPKLFKLATLQMAAGKLGYKDDDTLRIVQGLYEKKLLSYPRTSCEVLGTKDNIKAFLESARAVPDIEPFLEDVTTEDIKRVRSTKRWFDDAKVASEGHTALRPTTKKPNFESLSREEQDIYRLVARQFAAAFLPPLKEEKIVLLANVGEDTFRTAGKVCLDPGFTEIFGKKITDTPVPEHKKGDILPVSGHTITEKAASCPKHISSPDMIAICENPAKYLDDAALKKLGKRLKIGTPATRSSIIRQLIDRDNYLIEKKEGKKTYLFPTEKGEFLIRVIGNMTICKVDMTGQWEEQLEDIRTGKLGLEEFEESIKEDVNGLVEDIHALKTERFEDKARPAKDGTAPKDAKSTTRKEYGTCPSCGGTLLKNRYGWYCSNYKAGCRVSVDENVFKDSGITINDEEFKKLMEGESITIHPISKKTKEPYERSVHYDFKEDKIAFEEFGKKADRKWVSTFCCPFCGENLEENDQKLWCSCGCTIYKQVFGVSLTDDEIRQLCEDRKTSSFRSRKGRDGKSYSGRFRFTPEKKVTIQFPKKS